MVLGDLLRSVARRNPNATGIIFEEHSFTWKQVNERANRLANGLLSLGLQKGDKVAMFGQNSHRYAEIYFATAKAGLVSVPIGYQSAPAEAAYILNDSEAKALLVDAEFLPLIDSIRSQLGTVKHVIRMGEGDAGVIDYECLLKESASTEPTVEVFPDDLRSLGYTSGTTGKPKGCMISHGQMIATISNFLVEINVPHGGPTLLPVPFYTGYGAFQCFAAPYTRSTMVIQKKFNPTQALELIEKHRVTHMLVVPTIIIAMCNCPDMAKYDLSAFQMLVYGGSVIAPSVLKQAMKLFPHTEFCQNFGMMEAGGFIAFLTPEDHRLDGSEVKERRLYSTGREAQYAQVRLVDANGNEVPPNQVGELTVRSEATITGYWKMPEKTAETIRNGWVFTGDMAYRDDDGYIYVADRKKEMIVSGGMNIYPAEIETVLYTHPAIAQVAVIGVPDDRWGEAVKAVVELKKGAKPTEEEIIEFCRERLASYKKPKSVDFVDSLPVSSSGKVAKKELREKYWQGRERKI